MSENMNDINHLDPDDEGLSQIFGDRFHDESKTPAVVNATTPRKSTARAKKTTPVVADSLKTEPITPVWKSAETTSYSWLPRLKDAVYGILSPALLSVFFFWCQLTSRMDSTTAVTAMFCCVAIVFFRVGRVCAK